MQTPAERYLVQILAEFLKKEERKTSAPPRILNIGAGKSLSIENQLTGAGCNFICDRIDVDDCTVTHPSVEKCWRGPAEMMSPVEASRYSAAFANYVLEHVPDLSKAAREIYRVLKPSGIFVASTSNPTALEFSLARRTPLWFHKMVRRGEAWETHYSYKNLKELIKYFELAGFRTIEVKRYPFTEGYLGGFFLLNVLSRIYDKIISVFRVKRFMGNVCLVFEKFNNINE